MRDKGDLPAAIANYRKAILLKPDSSDAHADLAFTLKRVDRLPEALKEVAKAVQLSPGLARAEFYYGEILTQRGNSAAALPHYERAARLSPNDVDFRLKFGVLLAQTNPGQGVQELQEAARLAPMRADVLNALGAALRRAGDEDQAKEAFRHSREVSATVAQRSEAVLDTNKAIDSLKKGQVPPAIEFLRAALAADPEFADANHYMGIAQSAQQNWAEANRAFNAAVQESPSNPEIHFNFAISLEKQGDWEGAARELQSAVDLRPGQVPVMCQLAGALSHAGQTERARAELDQVKEIGIL